MNPPQTVKPVVGNYVKVTWCSLCRRYVGMRHVCAAQPPENVPIYLLRVP